MGDDAGHGYDSFVVRLWHEADSGALLRAEVEHVQSGESEVEVGSSWDWIRDWLRAQTGGGRQFEAPAAISQRRSK